MLGKRWSGCFIRLVQVCSMEQKSDRTKIVVTKIISNAYLHAFPQRGGAIDVSMARLRRGNS